MERHYVKRILDFKLGNNGPFNGTIEGIELGCWDATDKGTGVVGN